MYLQEDKPGQAILQRIANAFVDEDSAFNFPIKYPALDLDKPTKQALYKTAGIIAGGLIVMGFIIAYGKKRK
jgi:hypothetical protein